MRAVALALLVGCGSDPRDCSLPTVVDDYAAGATLDDCGSPYDDGVSGSDTAAFQAAQACALDHAQRHAPFRVTWTAQAIEGLVVGAFVGLEKEGAWHLTVFGQSPRGDATVPPTRFAACADLQAISPCQSLRDHLCIECVGETAAEQCMP